MKLHTKLNNHQINEAMTHVKERGLVADGIYFVQFAYENSQSHPYGYLIQLGTNENTTPGNKRRGRKQVANGDRIWAATYDEWGWFIAEIFECDPNAKFGYYKNYDDFHEKTGHLFK